MSYADKVFKEMCKDILENGTSTEGEKIRPIWTDTGEKAYTIKKFGVCNRYDLRKEFPALTLRKTGIKSAFDELLWIWQKKSNNIKDLSTHIWDEWADENGSIGLAYGYQMRKKYIHHRIKGLTVPDEEIENMKKCKSCNYNLEYKHENGGYINVWLDQTDGVIWDLKNNPFSRRIMTNIYNFNDLHDMHLYPCAYSMTFNVTKDRDSDKLVLNGLLNQRSQDILAASNWNDCQYALLIMALAQVCDMIPGEYIHMISDCHIYNRHIPIIKELIKREEYPAPKVSLNPEIKDFYQFTKDDVVIEDYEAGPQIKNIPIAV